MKKFLKMMLPNKVKIFIINYINQRIIKNYFNKSYSRTALLSYITVPFKSNSLAHTNYFEAQSWAKILSELGYNVDIIHYENKKTIDLAKYDLICGFGDVFQKYFESNSNKKIITIYYGTGMHVCHQNYASLSRIQDVYRKKGVWLGKSARFVEKTWTHQTTLVDGIIALGNEVCADSYRKYYDRQVYALAAPYYATQNPEKIILKRKEDSKNHYLWFGSSGLVHKGLDLILDYFSENDDIYLHICGPIENDKEFAKLYKTELFETKNIKLYGFVDIESQLFNEILLSCSFTIYPSCSEGGSPSTLSVIGNGGLIPIITKENTIETGNELWIDGFDYESIDRAVSKSKELSFSEIKKLQLKNLEYVKSNNNQEKYYLNLKLNIEKIIKGSL